ncbi:hypothetical protein, partial [Thiolapillus sp.]|uniref:hypothetical protein n=1 Tax=Thiolapillus sp. TaxID=2017437 RepID=UPI003AF51983
EWGSFLLVIQCLSSFDYTKRGYSIHLLSDCNLNKNTQNHGPSGRVVISYTYGILTRIMTAALLNFFR